jgi:tetratricopeptide (TPR) repeat protein
MRCRTLLVSLAALAVPVVGSAGQPENTTFAELALTPPVCQDVQAMPTGWSQNWRESPRAPYWTSLLGKSFWALHHYCWALVNLHRANQAGVPRSMREHLIRTTISDYYYVIRYAISIGETDMVMLPELYYRAGESYVLLGEMPQALEEFGKSRAAKADYWPPYVAQAKVQMGLGLRRQARELLEQGSKIMPDEPNIRAMLEQLQASPAREGGARGPAPAARSASQTAPR